ncbi:carnitine dehydratase [Variovorax sp. WS11]|uniref:CaiB/BaiF CoA transferase family protein n=1 Tax=Variovorax sp. WS11 TaxID=1105204 RepID=UPI000D0E1E54|nr:CoA transferase [Variovorax sp. WS11]NDZ18064.1 CoA transferase [Variovorax sp. WS11]PSL80004.1 carnitine dehydratase [Variovorax sp. WS11]
MNTSHLPLDGIRVLEVCNVAAGPFCGLLLADMGADVVKIENPDGGDTLRTWPPISDGYSENFASLNRNKRSVTLNLKNVVDREMFLDLAAESDVLVENNRPGVMERLGVSYRALKERSPKLVYCSISAYGQSGPRSQEGGFDLTIQAMSGIMSVTGERGGAPVKCGVPLADFSAGLYAAFSIVAALRRADRTGLGTHLDIPMLGATLGIAALQTSEYFGSGRDPDKLGSAHPRNAPYRVFRCRDGYFGMAAGNNALWKAVCATLGRDDLAQDDRFQSPTLRAKHQDALLEVLEKEFVHADISTWLERFRQAGVPCAPINSYSEVLQDPQVDHMGWVQPLELPNGVKTRTFLSPIRMDDQNLPVHRRPPALGEHNAEILGPLRSLSSAGGAPAGQ